MDKEVQLTKKHLTIGGSFLVAILVLQPVKEFFVTREESKAQEQRIIYLEMRLQEVKADLAQEISGSKAEIIDQIKESDSRQQKSLDKLERRVETLEARRRLNKSYN